MLGGTVLGLIDFYLAPDFGSGSVLFDAYLDAHPWAWLRLRAGKFKTPIGLERLQNDPDLPLPERAVSSDLSPVRDIGAQLWGEVAGGTLTYAVALLAGAPDSGNLAFDNGRHKDVAAALQLRPLAGRSELGSLGIALAATTGRRDGSANDTNLSPYKTVGQITAFSYLQSAMDADATVFAIGRHSRINPGIYYYYGSFGALAEAIWSRQHVRKDDVGRSLTHHAWHATVSYVLGGTNGYGGVRPHDDWRPASRHFGALELSARLGQLALDPDSFPIFADPTMSARRLMSLGFSANWVLSRVFRVALAYEQTWFNGGAGEASAIRNRRAENFLLTRGQLNF
jgi:phosphate-selective porin OprO/OprP